MSPEGHRDDGPISGPEGLEGAENQLPLWEGEGAGPALGSAVHTCCLCFLPLEGGGCRPGFHKFYTFGI